MGRSATACRSLLPEGVEVREGRRGSSIRITFIYQGQRRREKLDIPATLANIKYASRLRGEVINAIARGTFDYAASFPGSAFAKAAAPPSRKRQRIETLIDTYIDSARRLESLSPSSIACYARWARSRIIPQWGEIYLDELTTTDLREWIVKLSEALAPKSVRNCVGLLSAVLNRAAADGLIPSNPLSPIKLRTVLPKKKRGDDDKIDPFNDQEIRQILDACASDETRAIFQFAFATGLRTGELIALKWQNVNWARKQLHICDNVVSAEGGTVEKTTKTDSEREVPILPAAMDALKLMAPITGGKPGSYVFINPRTKKRWGGERVLLRHWTNTVAETAVRYRNPYQTRHTFASRLLMAGEPELLVAKLLGHTTVEMVRRHYGRYIHQPEGVVLRGDYSKFGY